MTSIWFRTYLARLPSSQGDTINIHRTTAFFSEHSVQKLEIKVEKCRFIVSKK